MKKASDKLDWINNTFVLIIRLNIKSESNNSFIFIIIILHYKTYF